jgi:hypothetical protein
MIRRWIAALTVAVGAIGGLALLVPAHAATVPPVCIRIPLPNSVLPGAQIQIGYCP